MPPAFNLSQDQTLQFNLCNYKTHLGIDRRTKHKLYPSFKFMSIWHNTAPNTHAYRLLIFKEHFALGLCFSAFTRSALLLCLRRRDQRRTQLWHGFEAVRKPFQKKIKKPVRSVCSHLFGHWRKWPGRGLDGALGVQGMRAQSGKEEGGSLTPCRPAFLQEALPLALLYREGSVAVGCTGRPPPQWTGIGQRHLAIAPANKCDTRAAVGERRRPNRQCGRPAGQPPEPWAATESEG